MSTRLLRWEITSKCNLKCKHCIVENVRHTDCDIDTNKKIIDKLKINGVNEILFTSKEPFAYESFLELVRYCSINDIYVAIITNGTLIDEEAITFLYRQKIKYIAISLDGWTAQSNDQIRGEGTFDKIIKTIERFSKENISRDDAYIPLYIQNLVTTYNNHEIDEMFNLLDKYPDVQISIGQITESGNASNNKECIITQSDFRKTKQEIMNRNKEFRKRIFFKDESYFEGVWFNFINGRSFQTAPPKCSIDKNYYTLLPNGDMCKCIMLKNVEEDVEYEAVFGNILNDVKSTNYNFDFDRSYKEKGSCKTCKVSDVCNLCYIISDSEVKLNEQRSSCDYYRDKIEKSVDSILQGELKIKLNKSIITMDKGIYVVKDNYSVMAVEIDERLLAKIHEIMNSRTNSLCLRDSNWSQSEVEEMVYGNLIFKA